MQDLYDRFLKEKRFLDNIAPTTVKFYRWTFNRWENYIGVLPTKQNIKEFVIELQESGITIYTTNSYIRGIDAFMSWLFENEHIPEHSKIKKLREPERILKLFSETQVKRLLNFEARTFGQKRLSAMI